MKKITSFILATIMGLSLVGCGANASKEKAVLQLALTTFVAAEKAVNPTWDTTKLLKDGNAAIAAWGVGATWEANVISELDLVQTDVTDIPNCNATCESLVVVFSGAIVGGIDIAESSAGATTASTALKAQVLAKPGVVSLKSASAYKTAWNKAITNKQLPSKYKL